MKILKRIAAVVSVGVFLIAGTVFLRYKINGTGIEGEFSYWGMTRTVLRLFYMSNSTFEEDAVSNSYYVEHSMYGYDCSKEYMFLIGLMQVQITIPLEGIPAAQAQKLFDTIYKDFSAFYGAKGGEYTDSGPTKANGETVVRLEVDYGATGTMVDIYMSRDRIYIRMHDQR